MQLFSVLPGVPLFESDDLVNWTQIGHVLTRESQLPLETAESSGGIFAPTIRYNDGRFYMVTTNISAGGNFYVYTDDIRGEWSEPIYVEQGGIDPSLYFEDGKAYFMSNGADDDGNQGITQCEIDIETGKKLSKSKCIWKGAGGRFLESPHLFKINGEYYLTAAEGGTEYGHMVVYAKGKTAFGPFENYPHNPVLTNRNFGGYPIQGCGHSDLVCDKNGSWWMIHLAFRQIGFWTMYHTTGRETYMMPVNFGEDGWFTVGENGTTLLEVETDRIPDSVKQNESVVYTFNNTELGREWIYLRKPNPCGCELKDGRLTMVSVKDSINGNLGCPAFAGIRQKEMRGNVSVNVSVKNGEAGITMYMDPSHHYDLALINDEERSVIVKRLCIGDIKYEQEVIPVSRDAKSAKLSISLSEFTYGFTAESDDKTMDLGTAQTKYISTEVAGGFTGVMIGLYTESKEAGRKAEFSDFAADMRRN